MALHLLLLWQCLAQLALTGIAADKLQFSKHELSRRELVSKSVRSLLVGPVRCTTPNRQVDMWWYDSWGDGPLVCTHRNDDDGMWAMLNAYRSGGKEDRHWKYTSDPNDPDCLVDWTYYGKDGEWVVEKVKGRLTKTGDKKKKNWCALPVYRKGGKKDKQWAHCKCIPE